VEDESRISFCGTPGAAMAMRTFQRSFARYNPARFRDLGRLAFWLGLSAGLAYVASRRAELHAGDADDRAMPAQCTSFVMEIDRG
jgi:hypothetical protein